MTTETAPLDPQALRFNREQLRLSQRELGRRVAERLGRAEATRAFQIRLHRLEQGDEVSEEDREMLDALAAELAIGVDDLATPPVWVWFKVDEGRPGFVELALRIPVFTSPEAAYKARDWLAHASQGNFTPFEDAQLVPMRLRTLTHDTLDANYPELSERDRALLVAVDPDPESKLAYLAGLNAVLNRGFRDQQSVDAVFVDLEEHGLFPEIVQLHELALRRLVLAPPEFPNVVASWRAREERLYELIERRMEVLSEYREKARAEKTKP